MGRRRAFWASLLALVVIGASCRGSRGAQSTGGAGAGGGAVDAGAGDGAPSADGAPPDGGDAGIADGSAEAGPSIGASVLQHHLHATRDGVYVQPSLTKAAVAGMTLDPSFAPTFSGKMYAQPLYVENGPSGKGTFYFVTETDDVYAVDETTGATVWTRNVGPPAAMSGAGCGNVSPLGITGTPVIDLARRAMYFDAVLATAPGDGGVIQTHLIHAVSIDDGAELPGWPVDTRNVSYGTLHFDPVSQNQRGALVIAGDTVYVPYGGHAGDCAHAGVFYHGWVIGVPLDDPAGTKAWATDAQLASIWGPGGLSSDGTSVFGATGNSLAFEQPGVTPFQHQNSVVRLQPGPVFSGQTTDFFAPANWVDLDNADLDLGGSGVLLVDVPGATPAHLAVALGKDGKAYLTDRTNLGGVGGDAGASPPATPALVAGNPIVGAPAWYTTAQGVYVVFVIDEYLRTAIGCAIGQGGDLAALRIHPGAPPTVTVAWCQDSHGIGSPSVTVAGSDTLVWTAGALESGKLHAFDGDTGDPVYTSAETMGPLTHWIVPIAVHGRIIVGGNGAAYAFKP